MAAALDHVVLEVRDIEASLAFYTKVLGFEPVRVQAFRLGEAPFPSVRVNGESIVDLFPPRLWRNARRPSNPNHVCFTMPRREVAAFKRRLKRRQVPIERRAARNFGARGYGRAVDVNDPDGVRVEVRYYPDAVPETAPAAN